MTEVEAANAPADAEMGENEEVAEGEEPMDGEDDELEEGDENEKKYVKKEYVAQPYNSEYLEKTIEEVEALSIKNSRPLIRIRVTKPRREFGDDNFQMIWAFAKGYLSI